MYWKAQQKCPTGRVWVMFTLDLSQVGRPNLDTKELLHRHNYAKIAVSCILVERIMTLLHAVI